MRTELLIGLLLFAGSTAVTEGSALVSMCENEIDVCVWRPDGGWERRWEAKDGFPVEYLGHTTGSGLAVIEESTSSSSGKISLVAGSGATVLERRILNGNSLNGVVGETGDGGLVLCQSTPFGSYCDTTLQGRSPAFPDSCLFPRAVRPGHWSCVVDGTDDLTIMISDGGDWVDYAKIPARGMVGNIVWRDGKALLLVGYTLLEIQKPGAPRVLDEDVDALWDVGDVSVYWKTECSDVDRGECEGVLVTIGDDGEKTTLMRGSDVMAAAVAREGKADLLVDLWGVSERVLRRFSRSADGRWSSGVLWRARRGR